ncbi:PCI domain-containing protein [Lentinula raphanica]|uniref:Eukaryotic translation initiation factor 3 subunit M n=1 Tax=Lentinula raphanica TaxID=153919 RepID=A0AA38PHJ3_9AGAR|nr:PCI domain-containing protein [Lentinula raphanica]KAJ3755642.1 PCI domain-containing protein [Lentinula raphanica]KAJ3771962.1 PCI domain-containing protein [Lentinula raphanica]KAJ3824120.1 PCI domain-containing protein [Lentinula raphanica]KAJ3843065.1 PCI domain-containing protein [Lentinula raphanica]
MSATDSVSVFAEGTFEEQVQELVNYIVRNQPDEERIASIRPFQEALITPDGQKPLSEDPDRRKKIFSMIISTIKGLGHGHEREIEGFYNLIYAHLLSLYSPSSPEAKQHVDKLLEVISAAPAAQTPIKYRILSNLFNALPRNSALRLSVYNTILKIAVADGSINALHLSRFSVEKWLGEWDISSEDKSGFLKNIADAYEQTNQPIKSYEYSLLYVRSLNPTSEVAKDASIQIISTALCIPSIFDFDAIFKLDAVVANKDHELFSLLQIFLNDGISEFQEWEASHPGSLEKYDLDRTTLERKIRLLTLASLGFKHVGTNLPYDKIAEAIQVDVSQVERWVIDVIRAGLLSGKLSQTTQTLHIIRSTARSFEREQWEALEQRLVAWKSGLNSVLDVVANAKRQGGHVAQNVPVAAA